MEAKSSCSGVAGEVRRIHIIYFLSHMSRIEHPHLIRVQHLTRNGVYLRDVKRWLADLRGKEMTESYAWSYKRKYKTGYVWQDLVDDDLINPISDNEYVLKGSQITGSTYFENKVSKYKEKNSYAENKVSKYKEKPGIKVDDDKEPKNNEEKVLLQKSYSFKEASQENQDSKIDTSIQSNISSEINEESTEFSSSNRSTLTDEFDSIKPIEQQQQQEQEQQQRNKFHNIISSSFKSKSPNRKSKSYSSGASNVFRNFISCKGVDTNDAVLVMSNRVQYKDKTAANNQPINGRLKDYVDGQISKGESLGGSARVIGSCWNMQQQQQIENNRRSVDGRLNWKKHQHGDFTEQKAVFAAYKPVGEPKCSQCGKPFKPEKMQSHMKSCRGIKALAKTTSVERTPITPSCKNSSVSAYFITN